MDNIIVGIDQSATARQAAETAASLTAACGATLHLMTCVKDDTSYDAAPSTRPGSVNSIAEAERFLRALEGELPHTRIVSTVGLGDPATSMCETATRIGADVIVVGEPSGRGHQPSPRLHGSDHHETSTVPRPGRQHVRRVALAAGALVSRTRHPLRTSDATTVPALWVPQPLGLDPSPNVGDAGRISC